MRHYISKENRALISELVRTDFKLRYQGSVLGYAWSLLRPLLLFVILYIVFVKFLKLGLHVWKDYVKFLILIGIVIILLGLSWSKHVDWLVKPAGILVILDAVLGWQARFLTSNFNYVLSKCGL